MKSANITGYRELSEDDINLINEIKATETALADLWKRVVHSGTADGRWMSIAKTHFQEGFTAFVRSIAKPVDPFLS